MGLGKDDALPLGGWWRQGTFVVQQYGKWVLRALSDCRRRVFAVQSVTAPEATQGQNDGFFSQLPYKYQNRVASVGD